MNDRWDGIPPGAVPHRGALFSRSWHILEEHVLADPGTRRFPAAWCTEHSRCGWRIVGNEKLFAPRDAQAFGWKYIAPLDMDAVP